MIKRVLSLFALTVTLAACGGGKYEHSEIPARAGTPASAPVEEPLPLQAPEPLAADVSSSNSKPVIYDYPGGTRQLGTPAPAANAAVPVTPPSSAAVSSGRTYTVQHGDTLWHIATNHGVTVDALKHANGLGDNIIKPGQILRIP